MAGSQVQALRCLSSSRGVLPSEMAKIELDWATQRQNKYQLSEKCSSVEVSGEVATCTCCQYMCTNSHLMKIVTGLGNAQESGSISMQD